MRAERAKNLEERAVRLEEAVPQKARRAMDLATEKGLSMSLTTLPLKELGFNLNKREFRDGLSLCYDWPIADIPSTCLCGEPFTNDHAIIGSCVIKTSVSRHSRPICRPTCRPSIDRHLGRHIGRHIGRHSPAPSARYVAIDCLWCIGRLSVVSEYCSPLFC